MEAGRKKDDALGGLIRQALREQTVAGGCPGPDLLAARYERTLSGAARCDGARG